MSLSVSKSVSAVAILLILTLALSACGRRGNLEPPPGELIGIDENTGEEIRGPAPQKRNEPFILDPLL